MPRTTKLELEQLLASANAEREALRTRVAEMEGTIEALKSQLAKAAASAAQPLRPTRPVYTPPAPTAEQLAFRARMAAARELAMRTGRTIRLEQA